MPRSPKIHHTCRRTYRHTAAAAAAILSAGLPGVVSLQTRKLQRCHLQALPPSTLGAVCSESQTRDAAAAIQSHGSLVYLSAGWFLHCFTRSQMMPVRERVRESEIASAREARPLRRNTVSDGFVLRERRRRGSLGCLPAAASANWGSQGD